MRGCCRGFLQQLQSKGEFSLLKHSEKETSIEIAGGKPPGVSGMRLLGPGCSGAIAGYRWQPKLCVTIHHQPSGALRERIN